MLPMNIGKNPNLQKFTCIFVQFILTKIFEGKKPINIGMWHFEYYCFAGFAFKSCKHEPNWQPEL